MISIEMPNGKQKDDAKRQWLSYWALYSAVQLAEGFPILSYIISCLPFMNLFKLMILVYLMNPITQGALTIYKKALRPFLEKNRSQLKYIDEQVNGTLTAVGA